SEGIGHVDEAPPGVLPTVLLRELRDLGLLGLPFILRIEDEALERVPAVLVQAAGEKLGERDFAPQPADMLEAADAQARIDDEITLSAAAGLRMDPAVIVPMRQRIPPGD